MATFPKGIDGPVQYGPRIKSTSVYLMNYQHLPYDRTAQAIYDLFGRKISPGTLFNFNTECYEHLQDTEQIIKEQILKEAVIHNDETGLPVDKKLNWLHTASTDEYTYYACHSKRGKEAMDDIGILPCYTGVSVHDYCNPI